MDIETISLRIRTAAVIIYTDPHVTNSHHTEQICSYRHAHGEWAVSHELVTLLAAAAGVKDEYRMTAGLV